MQKQEYASEGMTEVHREYLETAGMKHQALSFVAQQNQKNALAIFAHGYTSHKDSILNWGQRLSDEGINVIITDVPGHYLGSFDDIESWEVFQKESHRIFISAFNAIIHHIANFTEGTLILGGHSLGGLLALKAMQLNEFSQYKKVAVAAGLGMAPKNGGHVFDSKFFAKTMNIRAQLVSPCMRPEVVFPWIKKEKEELSLKNEEVYLVTGLDDAVVGEDGSRRLKELLESNGNKVQLDEPKSLPHHHPDRAAAHIYAYLKKNHGL